MVVIVGPTAVGKTELAIRLAERLDGEVVSADSRLLYRGMDIGTAKPTLADRRRVPHHLIDIADPDEVWSLAEYQRAANRVICAIHARGRLPLMVGGTGQYVRAIIEGWKIPAQPPNPGLRNALEGWVREIGSLGLFDRLRVLDPVAAAGMDSQNVRRTIRAIEVIFGTGKRLSDQRRRGPSPYRLHIIGLTRPRKELYRRVDARIDAMFRAGFIGEVAALLEAGYAPDLPAFSAIGYREAIAHLRAEIDLPDAVDRIKRRTRQLVRRQSNWFREDDPFIHWFQMESDPLDDVERSVRESLALDP